MKSDNRESHMTENPFIINGNSKSEEEEQYEEAA